MDVSLSKNFQIKESVQLQIRADMFNFLIHVNPSSLHGNVENSDFEPSTILAPCATCK